MKGNVNTMRDGVTLHTNERSNGTSLKKPQFYRANLNDCDACKKEGKTGLAALERTLFCAHRNQLVIVILGLTASGKSDLAVRVAKKYNGEIISADSRQVYRGLDIGTGKVTKREMRGIPHHLLNVASPKKIFTAAQFQKLGNRAINDILRRGKTPIICGGTGHYIDALIYDYLIPEVKPNKKLREGLEKKSTAKLFTQLKKLDPVRANNIDQHNRRRLIRALEIVLTTKKPVPPLELHSYTSPYETLVIGIQLPESILRKRIHGRLLARMKQGMIQEVRDLHKNGLSWTRMESLGLEYRYISRYLRGLLTEQEMVTQLEREICRYAKRQRFWFKRNPTIHWITKPEKSITLVKKLIIKNAPR